MPHSRDTMLAPKYARLLSFVLLAAVLPLLAIWALLMFVSTPTPTGGMEPTMAMMVYISMTIIFAALITVVVNFAMQLAREAKGKRRTP